MTRQFHWPFAFAACLALGCSADAPPTDSPPEYLSEDGSRQFRLEPAATATMTAAPFQQMTLIIDTTATRLDARVDGKWHPVDITWEEGKHKVGRLLLDRAATQLELRADQPWTFASVQLHDEVVATDVLARDLPFAAPSPNALAPADLVISRAQWGARDPNKVCGSAHNPVRMAIHHTAIPADDGGDAAARMRQMQAAHIDGNGWCDIGYHFVVSQAGQIYQGRSTEERTGAHVGGGNTGNVGVSLIGDFQANQVGDAQFQKVAEIVGWIGRTYDIPFNRTSIKGHREHAGQSTNCPGDNMLNRLEEMIELAQSGVPAGPLDSNFQVNVVGTPADFYQAGSSSGKPDFFQGDTLQAELVLENTTTTAMRNVAVGYWFESPHLRATSYTIESDAPNFDGTFTVNDADENPDNPAKDAMGTDGALGLYALAAGETKRVVIDLEVGEYSIGAADHPDVRGWVREIDGLYGEQSSFDMDPTNTNVFDDLLQGFTELDVLSRNEWQFDAGEPEQTEGWFGCSGVSPVVDVDRGAMTADFSAAGCVEAPPWTLIDADRWDELVLRMAVEDTHEAAIYWAPDGGEFSEDRAVSFKVDENTTTYVIPVGSHPLWTGEVARLRITPSLESGATAAIDAVFVQSSDGTTGSVREPHVSDSPVSINDDVVAPQPDEDDMPGRDTDGTVDQMPADLDDVRVKKGCATVAASPAELWWLLGFLFAIRRRRR